MRWNILLYGLALGLLLAALHFFQYRLWVIDYARELYTALVALLFVSVGIWAGWKWRTPTALPPADTAGLPAAAALDPEAGAEAAGRLGLTPREYEVLQLIAQGLTNQEIAARLFVSLNTVKTHISNIFVKLDVERRTQALHRAKALGLIQL